MKHILYYLLLLTAMWCLTSCSPNAKLRRAARLIKEAENSGAKFAADTVFVSDTVRVPIVQIDSIIQVQNWTDTITVTKDRVTTKVVVNPEKRIVYIASKCDPVTIIKKIPVTVTKSITVGDSRWRNFRQYLFGGLIGAFLMFVFFIVGRAAKWIV